MKATQVQVVDYRPEWQSHFERLNRAWIEQDFWLEPQDIEVLARPERYFIEAGGAILMAELNGQIVGTVALRKIDERTFELAKLAVDEAYRGQGIGGVLTQAVIRTAKTRGASTLVLYSNTKLARAIELYRKVGFREIPLEPGTFVRSNIKMELQMADAVPDSAAAEKYSLQ